MPARRQLGQVIRLQPLLGPAAFACPIYGPLTSCTAMHTACTRVHLESKKMPDESEDYRLRLAGFSRGWGEVLAERAGFEPAIPLRVCRISSAVLSTTQPPLRSRLTYRYGPENASHSC